MAGITDRINDDVKDAMRQRDKKRLAALRLIQAAFKQKEVDERVTIDDEKGIAILSKMAKQHRDSITQFKQAQRDDLVEKEQFELDIINTYLPEKMSQDEINAAIKQALLDTGSTSIKDMGKVMAVLKPKLAGRADMGEISKLLKTQLNT